MFRPRVGAIPVSPQQAEAILVLALIVLVSVVAVLLAEFVVLRGVAVVYRLTGHRPPRRSLMSAAISRLEEEVRSREAKG